MCFSPANPVKLTALDWYFERSEKSCIPFLSPPNSPSSRRRRDPVFSSLNDKLITVLTARHPERSEGPCILFTGNKKPEAVHCF